MPILRSFLVCNFWNILLSLLINDQTLVHFRFCGSKVSTNWCRFNSRPLPNFNLIGNSWFDTYCAFLSLLKILIGLFLIVYMILQQIFCVHFLLLIEVLFINRMSKWIWMPVWEIEEPGPSILAFGWREFKHFRDIVRVFTATFWARNFKSRSWIRTRTGRSRWMRWTWSLFNCISCEFLNNAYNWAQRLRNLF